MLFALLTLIQSQEPPRISKVVIVGVALFLILGIYLLVLFIRRVKTSEKEPEEDWDLSRRSLFVADPAPPEPPASAEPSQSEQSEPRATEMLDSPYRSQTRMLASEPGLEAPSAELRPQPEVEAKTEPLVAAEPPLSSELAISSEPPVPSEPSAPARQESLPEARKTEILTSPQIEERTQPKPQETMPFDKEIWAELEKKGQEPPASIEPDAPRQTAELRSPLIEPASNVAREAIESDRVARVEQRASREPFEPPRIEPAVRREPFEPPTVNPITPREQAEVMRGQKTTPNVTRDLSGLARDDETTNRPVAVDPNLLDHPPQPEGQPSPLYEPRATREFAADSRLNSDAGSTFAESPAPAPINPSAPAGPEAGEVWQTVNSRARERRAPAGAVLGLPLEGSQGPMVLGRSAKPADEIGIGSLSSYGKPLEKEGGRGGTIALLLAVLIVGGGLASYFMVPSVHSQVDAWVARARGVDPNASAQSTEPKAMIFPGLSEPNKNMVKAKGVINNISTGPLENLELEVSLDRGNGGPSEVRNISIAPAQIEPNGRGAYEFEYDGSRDTGFVVYKIKRLLSNGNPVRFTSPAQQK